VVQVLKKEIMKTQSKDLDKASEYRQALVQAIHSCAVKFPDVAGAGWLKDSLPVKLSAAGSLSLERRHETCLCTHCCCHYC
jgi:hypothetical protein